MGKVIKLNESDIQRIVKRVLTEQEFTKKEKKLLSKIERKEYIEPSDIPSDAHQSLKDCMDEYNRLLKSYTMADTEKEIHDRSMEISGLDCIQAFQIGL